MAFLDARELRLSDLLTNPGEEYKIPDYQRPYSWDTTQWEQLFADINELSDEESHFLGSFVVIPEAHHKIGINTFEVVDGQQRLTTICIILMAIRDIAPTLSDDINYWLHCRAAGKPQESKLKLSAYDHDHYMALLDNRAIQKTKVIKCYDYFRGKFSDSEKANNFLNKLIYRSTIVHINAFSLSNAFKLFETMNDRGLDLSAADLIKNYIFKKTASNNVLFKDVKSDWNEMYVLVKDIDPVKFIRRFLLAKYQNVISERKLYEGVRDKIDKFTTNEILTFVQELKSYSYIYSNIYSANYGDSEIDSKLADLNSIKVLPSFSLLLKLFCFYEDKKIPKKTLLDIMRYIEVLHIRTGVVGQSTSDLDRFYNKLATEADNNLVDIDTFIKNAMKEYCHKIDSEYFIKNFSENEFNHSDTRTKYILWRLDNRSDATVYIHSNVNTEHIMPLKLKKEWYIELGGDESSIDIEHEKHVNLIGNYCLLEHAWNRAMQNDTFDKKANGVINKAGEVKYPGYKDSNFGFTKRIADDYKSWDFAGIRKRSLELAKLADNLWIFK